MISNGIYIDIEEKEYRSDPALNYSLLAAFHESPDHALMKVEPKSYFEFGKAFELLIRDITQGTELFSERFFVCDASGEMPDNKKPDKDLSNCIDKGMDLNELFNLKNNGERSDTSKRLHQWLDCCLEHPGKMPKSEDEMQKLNTMADNFLKMKVFNHTMSELLPEAIWNVGIFWEKDGIKKKALVDCMIVTEQYIYPFDIKTTANFAQFHRMFRSKYWIQNTHYQEGVSRVYDEICRSMRCLAASKEEPYLSRPVPIHRDSRESAEFEYKQICIDCHDWIQSNRPAKGFLEEKGIKLYFD